MIGFRKKNPSLLLKYLKIYEKNPSSLVFAPLAETYRKLGMINEALKILKKGIREHPDYLLGNLSLGACYFDIGKYNLAYETLRHYVEESAENIQLQKLWAQICDKSNKREEALRSYKHLIFLNPRDGSIKDKIRRLEKLVSGDVERKNDLRPRSEKTKEEPKKHVGLDPSLRFSALEVANSWQWQCATSDKLSDNWRLLSLDNFDRPVTMPSVVNAPTTSNASSSSILPTLTLVDLYMSQGYFQKAQEVLEKLSQLNSQDWRIQEKVNCLKNMRSDIDQEAGQGRVISGKLNLFLDKLANKRKEICIKQLILGKA